MAAGISSSGGRGSPGTPQPERSASATVRAAPALPALSAAEGSKVEGTVSERSPSALTYRRGRTLTYEDLEQSHDGKSVRRGYLYSKVVTALPETIRLMAAIDAAIPKWPLE